MGQSKFYIQKEVLSTSRPVSMLHSAESFLALHDISKHLKVKIRANARKQPLHLQGHGNYCLVQYYVI